MDEGWRKGRRDGYREGNGGVRTRKGGMEGRRGIIWYPVELLINSGKFTKYSTVRQINVVFIFLIKKKKKMEKLKKYGFLH